MPRATACSGLDRWFGELFAKAAADRQAGTESIYVRGAAWPSGCSLTSATSACCMVTSITTTSGSQSRGWLAFDPKGLVGERTYDCANTLCNPGMPELVHNETRLLTNAAILATCSPSTCSACWRSPTLTPA